ncbi:hypothetical protein SAMN04488134_1043 [Amphibacillus marinus]|uniref:Uncharacterized protein n=1 Tax=Amphibacillus marinus TaxID=872970 RepID=A0A1H8M1Y4_9BACI|nr:hypothetical protein [Amphibacillus marinus]SEO11424.1 hypothetical protein SAMN04488134_1043 [Amphibacillus marinus]
MLKMDEIQNLLAEKNIKMIVSNKRIYIDDRSAQSVPLENHYGISREISKDDTELKWSYCFYFRERRNTEEIRILKQFNTKEKALNYLFFKEISRYFMSEFIIPSRSYEIEHWTFEKVRRDMERLNIPAQYLSDETKVVPNSIIYQQKNNLWYTGFINDKKEKIYESPNGNGDSEWFFSLYGNDIYLFFLFDKYTEELLDRNIIEKAFSDQVKLIVLDYK